MRLAARLTLVLWVAVVLVLSAAGWDRLRREATLFESDMARDHTVMGRGIAAGVAEVWEREGQARALDIVGRANQRESTITIRWIPAGGPASAPSPVVETAWAGEPTHWTDRAGSGRIVSYVPVLVNGQTVGAIELDESLEAELAYTRTSALRVVAATGALAALTLAISVALGVFVVGRPVRQLVEKAQRVGNGDFRGDLVIEGRDELSALAAEMNRMAHRLELARGELEAASRERLAALEQLRHAERVGTLGTLAAGVAHELGTPLNVIAWRARRIAEGRSAGPEAEAEARVVVEQCDRIVGIIGKFLDFARRRPSERVPVDLGPVLVEARALVEPTARRTATEIEVDLPEVPVQVKADASQMVQVLTNLLVNSCQAGARRVKVGLRVEEGSARLVVEDDGVGFSPEVQAQLFDPFFTTKGVGGGTGLGLSVVWGIIAEHEGRILATSEGRGARFEIIIPEGR